MKISAFQEGMDMTRHARDNLGVLACAPSPVANAVRQLKLANRDSMIPFEVPAGTVLA